MRTGAETYGDESSESSWVCKSLRGAEMNMHLSHSYKHAAGDPWCASQVELSPLRPACVRKAEQTHLLHTHPQGIGADFRKSIWHPPRWDPLCPAAGPAEDGTPLGRTPLLIQITAEIDKDHHRRTRCAVK